MLDHIVGVQWIGGLSLEDADVLAMLGKQSKSILEFGVGGSTMIFSQVVDPDGKIISLDTSAVWIDEVKRRMSLVTNKKVSVEYRLTDEIPLLYQSGCKFDLIFIDGLSKRRLEMALKTWPLLSPEGIMIFHDTRKQQDVLQVQDMLAQKISEVESVRYNIPATNGEDSNVTAIYKRRNPFTMHRHQYIDLQSPEEHREMWTFGRIEDYNIENGLYQYKGP